MYNNYSIFEYYSVSSKIHKLSSIYKIISLIILVFALLFSNSFIDIMVINLYIFLIVLWSNISFRLYFSNLRVFRFLLLILFVFVILFSLNILLGLLCTIKVFDLLIFLIIITITTSLNDMVNGFYRLFKPFGALFDIKNFSLFCSLSFKFFGICYGEYNRIKISQKIRGVRFNNMNFFDRVVYIIYGLRPVLKKSIDKLKLLKKNMYIRDYGVSDYISNYRLNKWRKLDTMLLIVNFLVLIVTFIY